ncbi:hypothetical protein HMPREF1869_01026 [Bacteroidales bacterium KA00251]|nr:hypothetical protein HMPREF1869_01026 [Bacteroidales bacterium KA00251]
MPYLSLTGRRNITLFPLERKEINRLLILSQCHTLPFKSVAFYLWNI